MTICGGLLPVWMMPRRAGFCKISSTEALVSLLADMYGLNADKCLRNFQATEPDPDTNGLLQDPIAEAALGPIPGGCQYYTVVY